MAKRIIGTTPKQDGFRMPGEYEPQDQVWMLWPERPDVWRSGAKPAQKAYVEIAKAISEFTPVTVCASKAQYANARYMLPRDVRVVEMSADDAWIRDTGPTFVINDKGDDVLLTGNSTHMVDSMMVYISHGIKMMQSLKKCVKLKELILTVPKDSFLKVVLFM